MKRVDEISTADLKKVLSEINKRKMNDNDNIVLEEAYDVLSKELARRDEIIISLSKDLGVKLY